MTVPELVCNHTPTFEMLSGELCLPPDRDLQPSKDLREALCNTRLHEKLGPHYDSATRGVDRSVAPSTVRASARCAETSLRRCLSWQLNQPVTRTGKEIGHCNSTGLRHRTNIHRRRRAGKHGRCPEIDRAKLPFHGPLGMDTIVRYLQQSSTSATDLVTAALDDRQLMSDGTESFKRLSCDDLVRQLALVNDCVNILHHRRHERLEHGDDQTLYDEKFAANLEYLLLRARQSLATELALRLIKFAMRSAIEQLDEWTRKGDLGGDQWSAEYASDMPPPSTTWPWSIKPCLAVIWGVCWMFYAPQNPGDRTSADSYVIRSSQQVPGDVFFNVLSGHFPPPEEDAYRRYGQQLLGNEPASLDSFNAAPAPSGGHSRHDDEGFVAVQGPTRRANANTGGGRWARARQPRHVAPGPAHRLFSGLAPAGGVLAQQAVVASGAGGCNTGITAGVLLPAGRQVGYNNAAHAPPPPPESGLQCAAPSLFLPEAVGNVWNETPELHCFGSAGGQQQQHFAATSPPFANANSHLIGSAHPVPAITVTPSDAADVVVAAQAPTVQRLNSVTAATYEPIGHQAFLDHRQTADNAYFVDYFDPTSPTTFSQLATQFSHPAHLGESVPMGFITANPPVVNHQLSHIRPEAYDEPPSKRRRSDASDARRASTASDCPSTSNMSERGRDEETSPTPSDPPIYSPLGRGFTLKREGDPPRNDDGKFVCEVGDRCRSLVFDRKCEWGKHMDKHERPYRCDRPECSKLNGFTYSGGLLRHQREVHKMHGGTGKQLFCPISNCKRASGSGFTRKENLQEHLRRVHRRTSISTTDMSINGLVNPVDDDDQPQTPASRDRFAQGTKRERSHDDEDEERLSDPHEKIRRLRRELDSKDDMIRELGDRLRRLEQTVGQAPTSATGP